jgi:hypothetical protein
MSIGEDNGTETHEIYCQRLAITDKKRKDITRHLGRESGEAGNLILKIISWPLVRWK